MTSAGLDLAERLLYLDPIGRPDCEEALQMPYFITEDPPAEMPTMCVILRFMRSQLVCMYS
jgi:CTD kinase subunit alpha